MFSKRFLDLAWKPFSTFQSFVKKSPVLYQRTSNGLALEESSNDSHNSNSNSSQNQRENFEREENYYEYTSNPRGAFYALPFFAIMTHKLNQVSCFFTSNKPEVNNQNSYYYSYIRKTK